MTINIIGYTLSSGLLYMVQYVYDRPGINVAVWDDFMLLTLESNGLILLVIYCIFDQLHSQGYLWSRLIYLFCVVYYGFGLMRFINEGILNHNIDFIDVSQTLGFISYPWCYHYLVQQCNIILASLPFLNISFLCRDIYYV